MIETQQFELIEKFIQKELSKSTREKLLNFAQLFKFYNSHTNLVSKNDEKYLFEKHIYDSLALSLFLADYKIEPDAKILDIGTGGGFPSVPLAIVFPDLQIFPLDSIAKKIGFIELVQKELRLDNLHPLCTRVEDLPFEYKQSFDVVTSRAVASLNILLEYAVPFLKTNGFFAAYKSVNADEEMKNAKNALSQLYCTVEKRIKYELPVAEKHFRELILIQKHKNTPSIYPRKSGQAKRNPL